MVAASSCGKEEWRIKCCIGYSSLVGEGEKIPKMGSGDRYKTI